MTAACDTSYPTSTYAHPFNAPRSRRVRFGHVPRPHGAHRYNDTYSTAGYPFPRMPQGNLPAFASNLDPEVCGRVATTYGYAAAGLATSLAAGTAAFSAGLPLIAAAHPIAFFSASLVGTLATLIPTMTIDSRSTVAKHVAWLSFSAAIGVSACAYGLLGSAVLLQAGIVTAGVVGVTALIAGLTSDIPTARFVAPITAGVTVLTCGMLATAFIPALAGTTATVMTMSAGISSLVMLLDMHALVQRARNVARFDPIEQSLLVHLDSLEIFMRVAIAAADAEGRK